MDFVVDNALKQDQFEGTVNAVFLVTNKGNFRLIYANSPYPELKKEIARVFSIFPKVTPAQYNNISVEMQFVFPITFPLTKETDTKIAPKSKGTKDLAKTVKSNVTHKQGVYAQNTSQLNIPFQYLRYIDYEKALHQSTATHTASKPFLYSEISKYINLDSIQTSFIAINSH